MADLELRKAALEASGLTVEMWPCYHYECGSWCPYWDLRCTFDALSEVEKARWKDKLCIVDIREDSPSRHIYAAAVESDPGAFWPWFLGLCREHRWDYWFQGGSLIIPDDCYLYEADGDDKPVGRGEGATPQEAGCKAVIAAAKRKEQA